MSFKSKIISYICLAMCIAYIGCASRNTKKEEVVLLGTSEKEVQELERIFLLEDASMFETKRDAYFKTQPNSQYVQYVHLLSSKMSLKKNFITEALATNLEVQNKTFNSNKEIYYLAVFESADIYEAQEKYDKSLAALVESEKNKKYLPLRKRLFELPLKLSVAYSRLNLIELTFKYIKETQNGLNEYLKMESLDNAALAKLYLEIGGGLTQWQSNDFSLELRKFLMTYKFLIYSMNLNDADFSDKAQKKLKEQVRWIWNLSQMQRTAPDLDRLEEEKAQFLKMTEFSKLLNSIKMFEPLEGQKKSAMQKEFFDYVEQVQDVVLEKIFAQYRYTPPTQESFRHQIFRENLTIENLENQYKK